jgi:plastocyanin
MINRVYRIVLFLLIACLLGAAGCSTPTGPVTEAPAATVTPSLTGTPAPTSLASTPDLTMTTVPGSPSHSATTPVQPVTVDLVAKDFAFNTRTITVPAGAAVRIHFNNQDTSVVHNFALYEDESATKKIFVGDRITGPKTIVYSFTAPSDQGTYHFQCDPHASFMKGVFIVT